MLVVIIYFLLISYTYTTALLVYAGYQVTFSFGSYLVRAETILLRRSRILTFLDVTKQKGYLVGMFISFVFYKILEYFFDITSNQEKVYNLHILLLILQLVIIYKLYKSFRKKSF